MPVMFGASVHVHEYVCTPHYMYSPANTALQVLLLPMDVGAAKAAFEQTAVLVCFIVDSDVVGNMVGSCTMGEKGENLTSTQEDGGRAISDSHAV